MKFERIKKDAFAVIGKEGSTFDGAGFIKSLWEEANSHFEEIAHLVKKSETGGPAGIWGAMTDFSRTFSPWQDDYSQGLYLAGAECEDEALAPQSWAKWVLPASEYLYTENSGGDAFRLGLSYLEENGLPLVGAVQEFNCPETGKAYLFFPIRRL